MTYKGYVNDKDLNKFADALTESNNVTKVKGVNTHGGEIEAYILIENSHWGLPTDIHELMKSYRVVIVDFSHVSAQGIELVFTLQ